LIVVGEIDLDQRVAKILEVKGLTVLNEARKVMIEDVKDESLRAPLQYLAEHWNDTLRPSLMALSCEAVGGEAEATTSAATAMTLLCSSMNIYNHIMDKTEMKKFVSTMPGKFGSGLTLIVAGLVTAKAFHVLSNARRGISASRLESVNRLFLVFLSKMSEAEALNLRLRKKTDISNLEKLQIIKMQAVDFEACMKIGATIGRGSESEVENLGEYGLCLGTAIGLKEDLLYTMNLTGELVNKMKTSPPYVIVWAINQSERARQFFSRIATQKEVLPADVEKAVKIMFESGAIDNVRGLIDEQIRCAIASLEKIGEGEARHALELLAEIQCPTHLFASLLDYGGGQAS